MAKNYWLIKSDPEEFSLEDLKNSKDKTTYWNGVRNYQARNFMSNKTKKDDSVLFYHSNADPNAVVGTCEIAKGGYPDHTQFDPDDIHFFPSAKKEDPTWFMVDVKFVKEFKHPVTLEEIKENPKLKNMKLVQKGNRLSIMPVEKSEFDEVVQMGSRD
jgi:predicted RNA-binding protein with PUA-like domain